MTKEIETLQTKFKRLRDLWNSETMHLFSVSEMAKHPAYLEIISMGKAVLPLIIEDMKYGKSGFWYYAIHVLTGSSPEIPSYARGKIHLLNLLYIAWYEEREDHRAKLKVMINIIVAERGLKIKTS